MEKFKQRKKSMLEKKDKSFKQSWDEKISDLCEKINSMDCYYTTSSCAGRVVLMIDQVKKEDDLFLKVWHNEIGFDELKKELGSLCSSIDGSEPEQVQGSSLKNSIKDKEEDIVGDNSFIETKNQVKQILSNSSRVERGNLIKFKQESCILHVACVDLESANILLEKARQIGWKRSGIISGKEGFIVELNSTEKLEFPIIANCEVLVGDDFLRLVVEQANEKLNRGWGKIEKLEEVL